VEQSAIEAVEQWLLVAPEKEAELAVVVEVDGWQCMSLSNAQVACSWSNSAIR